MGWRRRSGTGLVEETRSPKRREEERVDSGVRDDMHTSFSLSVFQLLSRGGLLLPGCVPHAQSCRGTDDRPKTSSAMAVSMDST
ncbi:hypothetical protein B296_00006044 [Ensete ventricosum]|uniref:Uncharacterized protein n=1 Tax=Ensete ventricosum TaxID=4639 RepID=A0A427AQA7_ENSVE|nr:hypothetical protein B296_00006044 [Ensete ventricosum]